MTLTHRRDYLGQVWRICGRCRGEGAVYVRDGASRGWDGCPDCTPDTQRTLIDLRGATEALINSTDRLLGR